MVIRSPLFQKLLFSAFLLIAATLLFLDFFVTGHIAARETQAVQHRLTMEARILAGEARAVTAAQMGDWAKEASARAGARVTIVDPKGAVLTDSEHDPETMRITRAGLKFARRMPGKPVSPFGTAPHSIEIFATWR